MLQEEMATLDLRVGHTSTKEESVWCEWIYTVKLNLDEYLTHLKARLVVKGYSQVYELDYVDTFSSVAKLTSGRFLVSLASHFISWILKMPFSMIFLVTFTWINH